MQNGDTPVKNGDSVTLNNDEVTETGRKYSSEADEQQINVAEKKLIDANFVKRGRYYYKRKVKFRDAQKLLKFGNEELKMVASVSDTDPKLFVKLDKYSVWITPPMEQTSVIPSNNTLVDLRVLVREQK